MIFWQDFWWFQCRSCTCVCDREIYCWIQILFWRLRTFYKLWTSSFEDYIRMNRLDDRHHSILWNDSNLSFLNCFLLLLNTHFVFWIECFIRDFAFWFFLWSNSIDNNHFCHCRFVWILHRCDFFFRFFTVINFFILMWLFALCDCRIHSVVLMKWIFERFMMIYRECQIQTCHEKNNFLMSLDKCFDRNLIYECIFCVKSSFDFSIWLKRNYRNDFFDESIFFAIFDAIAL